MNLASSQGKKEHESVMRDLAMVKKRDGSLSLINPWKALAWNLESPGSAEKFFLACSSRSVKGEMFYRK